MNGKELDRHPPTPIVTESPGVWLDLDDLGSDAVVVVTTESGSRFELDFGRRTALRSTAGDTLPDRSVLRGDEELIPLLDAACAGLGEPLVMLLAIRDDGMPTLRTTSPVVSITNRQRQP